MQEHDVIIIGAGLAGLCCARRLAAAGRACLVLEAADRVGGRVATDRMDGFLLDRGFQVFLDSYPEARAVLDYGALGLSGFEPGALVQSGGRRWHVADGWRRPWEGAKSLLTPVVSLRDAAATVRLRRLAMGPRREDDRTAGALLEEMGFSASMLQGFLRPFFRGVTLDPKLGVPADYFLFLFAMFARGQATLPADGMQAIPEQIASSLPAGTVRLAQRVASVEKDAVTLDDGQRLRARQIVVATDGGHAAELLTGVEAPKTHGNLTIYFAAETSPLERPILVLNGENSGPVNHLCVLSDGQPTYAPPGASLIAASIVGSSEVPLPSVRDQLRRWFGPVVDSWRHLRTDRIPRALPVAARGPASRGGVWLAGDHTESPSIQGAMVSGRRIAEAILAADEELTARDAG